MEDFLYYLVTFSLVFVGYIFVQIFMDRPDTSESKQLQANLPPLLGRTYWLLAMFSSSVGPAMRRLLPLSSILDIEKQLKMGNLHVEVNYILTAQVVYSLLLMVLGFFGAAFLLASPGLAAFAALLGALLGWIMPTMLISSLASTRQKQILKALPFAIDLLASAMRSGLDFTAAVNYYVTQEGHRNVLAQEFGLMMRDMQLGKTRIEALESMIDRIQSDDFTSFASAVIHGTEIGAAISQTIKVQGEEMRRRRFARAEEQAGKAPGKMLFPMAIFIMPAFFLMLAVPLYTQFVSSRF